MHAEDLLDRPAVCATLKDALSGCALSIGTTTRARKERAPLPPREAARRLVAARGEVAVVFGDERSGMTAEEVEAVDLLSCIPSDPQQPSWNLAQAIAVYAYEVRMAFLARAPPAADPPGNPRTKLADPSALAAIDRALAEAAASIRKPHARRRLYRSLERASLSPREAALWTAFLRSLK